jgi:hypothetical protein
MIRRFPTLLILAAIAAIVVAACGATAGPVLTDPKEIVTAALKSSEAAKTVHVDATVDGSTSVKLPGAPAGAPVTLTGTTGSADVDLANGALHATFAVPALFGFAGEVIVVDGKAYLKTTQSGDQFVPTDLDASPVDPSDMSGLIDDFGDLLLGDGVTLAKGDDIACGSKSCYTVGTTLTPAQIAAMGGTALAGLPIDLTGATLTLTVRVEKDAPNHLAGLTAELTTPGDHTLKLDLTFSKWDGSVSIAAPPADQVKSS